MKTYLIGYFTVAGSPDSVETPVIGNAAEEKRSIIRLARQKHPKADSTTFVLTGTRFETREDKAPGFIEVLPGQTLRQLFQDIDGNDIGQRMIGTVFFSGEPYEVNLVFNRNGGVVSVLLAPQLPHGGPVRFQNPINPQRSISELEVIIREVLGSDVRDLRLNIREGK